MVLISSASRIAPYQTNLSRSESLEMSDTPSPSHPHRSRTSHTPSQLGSIAVFKSKEDFFTLNYSLIYLFKAFILYFFLDIAFRYNVLYFIDKG